MAPKQPHLYEEVKPGSARSSVDLDDDSEEFAHSTRLTIPRRRWCGWTCRDSALGAMVLLSLSLMVVSIATNLRLLGPRNWDANSLKPTYKSLGTCGNSPSEARARGCSFDIMVSGWIKNDCFDQAAVEKYLANDRFVFWREPEAINRISMEEVQRGEHDTIYTNGSFHFQHYAYMWHKQVRAWDDAAARAGEKAPGVPLVLDDRVRSPGHNDHCLEFVGNPNVTYLVGEATTKLHQFWDRLDCIVAQWNA